MSESNEKYSSGERATIFSIYAVASLIASIAYLCCRINFKQNSKIIFIICVIYATAFVYLDLLGMFDLVFNNVNGFSKFSKFIAKYYQVFNWIDKALGFVIFNLLIYYLESGYHLIHKKLLDGFIRTWYSITKLTKCQIIVKLAVAIPLIAVLLVLLIVYRDHYDLGKNPMDYVEIILNCYSIFEIYVCVGFFVLQIILDCRRKSRPKLINRYYRYSSVKIIEKTEKYLDKLYDIHNNLNNALINFEKNDSSSHYKYLKETVNKVKAKIDEYDYQANNPVSNTNDTNDNNNQNLDYNNTLSNFNYNNNEFPYYMNEVNNLKNNQNQNDQNTQAIQINQIENNEEQLPKQDAQAQNMEEEPQNKEEQNQKQEVNKNEKKNEIDLELATSIRKYKKGVRRITKLKKLYKEIEIERNKDLTKTAKCSGWYILFFINFGIVIMTDIALPIILNMDETFIDDKMSSKKENSILSLAIGVILTIPVAVLCSSYTIITIFSTNRRQYITGDFLYGRKINDDISLMKTIQIICGYSFALLYCNLYYWKAIDKDNVFGSPYFYEEIIIPDYVIKNGISVYMILKLAVIIGTIIISLYFSNFFVFKNDLAEYNLSRDGCVYDNEIEYNKKIAGKQKIINILNHE